MPLWLSLTTILLALLFLSLQLFIFSRASTLSDGYSYFNAWETIKGGHTDQLRTPVYAIFAGILKEIFGKDTALAIIPAIHWGLYIIALRGVWQIDCWLGISHRANIAVILSLMLIPGFWCFNHLTMAETFSTCGVILLVWLSGRYIHSGRKSDVYLSGATLIVLIFTKPMFIFLIPLMVLFWGIVCRNQKSHLLAGGVSVATAIGLICLYMYCMAHTYTVSGLTIASTYNNYYCMRADGLIIPDEIEDADLRERFRPMYEELPGGWLKTQPYWQEMWQFNWNEMNSLVETARKNHPREVVYGTARRFKVSLTSCHFYCPTDELGLSPEYDRTYATWNGLTKNQEGGYIYPFNRHLGIPIWVGLVILALFTAIWLRRWKTSRRFPTLAALTAAVFLTAYLTAVIGAQDSWGRIMTPVNPLVAIMGGSIVSILWFSFKHKRFQNVHNKNLG